MYMLSYGSSAVAKLTTLDSCVLKRWGIVQLAVSYLKVYEWNKRSENFPKPCTCAARVDSSQGAGLNVSVDHPLSIGTAS
jgi:hypothetical protein